MYRKVFGFWRFAGVDLRQSDRILVLTVAVVIGRAVIACGRSRFAVIGLGLGGGRVQRGVAKAAGDFTDVGQRRHQVGRLGHVGIDQVHDHPVAFLDGANAYPVLDFDGQRVIRVAPAA